MAAVKKSTFKTDLISLEPYILGKKFLGEVKNLDRCRSDILERFLTMLEENDIAKSMFDAIDISADFYKCMVDFKEFIPKEQRDEVFYAAKVGKFYRALPSFCVYILQKAWAECHGIPNLLFKIVPIPVFKKFCASGYFMGGLTIRDAVCNVCTEEYVPLGAYNLKNKLKDFTEIYIPSTDMVAAVPHDIGDALDDAAINDIVVGPNGLETDGVLLRTMCNRVGAINSTYDLRELL